MNRNNWAIIAAVVFAVFFTGGLFLPDLPIGGEGQPDETIRAFYADSENRARVIAGSYLSTLAALAFIVFVAYLYSWLRSIEPSFGWLSTVVLVAGAVTATLLLAGSAALGALAIGIGLGGEPEQLGDTGVARFVAHTGYALVLLSGAFSAALLVVATSIAGLQTGAFPGWLNWGGFLIALLLLLGIVFVPMLALPIWVLAASIAMRSRPAPLTQAVAGL